MLCEGHTIDIVQKDSNFPSSFTGNYSIFAKNKEQIEYSGGFRTC